jgi:hypothetical protein
MANCSGRTDFRFQIHTTEAAMKKKIEDALFPGAGGSFLRVDDEGHSDAFLNLHAQHGSRMVLLTLDCAGAVELMQALVPFIRRRIEQDTFPTLEG